MPRPTCSPAPRTPRGVRWLTVVLLALGLLAAPAAPAARAAPVWVLQLRDAIGPASADYIVRGLTQAAEAEVPLVVIEMDTPGGLDSAMRQMIQAILASPVPVAIHVAPEGARAASAGTYLLYAAHIAAMAPATTLGAATPVAIGLPGTGGKPPEAPPASGAKAATDPMTAKRENDAAAFIRGLAQLRGRNAEWAERAVREAATLTAREALRDGVVDVVATDLPDLLAQIDGRRVAVRGGEVTLATRGLETRAVPPDARQRLLAVIANPNMALLLMMIGLYGLIFEFSSPGFGVAGIAGAICLVLAAFALQMLPVNYAGLALVVFGLALMAVELVTPTLGILGAGGMVAFVAGALLLFDRDVPGFGVPLWLILGLAASSAVAVFGVGGMALKARRRRVVSGPEEMVDARGEVLAGGDGGPWARVHGERWRVRSDRPLAVGQRVRVRAVDGLTLDVTPEPPAPDPGEAP